MQSTLAALQSCVAGSLSGADVPFDGVCIDSRQIRPGNLFVALRGEHFDAHDFIPEVLAKGAAALVVQQLPPGAQAPALVVADSRIALGQIAHYWRSGFTLPVIGVTGSNGKTTVKEMIAAILAAAFGAGHYLATRGNLNNEIGVPLTLFGLHPAQCAAVIELGMNHPGEIGILAAIAQPTVGLVNNAQREHQEFMASVAAVAEENGAVIRALPPDGIAVFPADDPFSAMWRGYAQQQPGCRSLTFGLSEEADVHCTYRANDFGSDLSITANGCQFELRLAAAGAHNVRNALAATACALAIGIDAAAIRRGLESFVPVKGRLQRKRARNGACVIDDTYNANPDSVRAAIDVLAQAASPRILVLGDMGEVGSEGQQFHREIGSYARSHGIDHLLAMGDLTRAAVAAFGAAGSHYADLGALTQAAETLLTPAAAMLVKGSRFMRMERLVQALVGDQSTETH
ncbi:MAG TPA: UDP-N-acetylmuramoyl-tripeptide--D-alanyl-D-alanine ligase [Burkholderiaceae bacterium]|nr:UDP-N-acetylmuramoyl-tripeptide--D-alanyl-D-alanine ligase [Burkholderiaceae bacterium]